MGSFLCLKIVLNSGYNVNSNNWSLSVTQIAYYIVDSSPEETIHCDDYVEVFSKVGSITTKNFKAQNASKVDDMIYNKQQK